MQFNINDTVRVKLTEHGRAVHAADHVKFWASVEHPNPPSYSPPTEDGDGWSKWQLWALMEAFGPHVHLGFRPCFESVILLEPENG